MPSYKTHSIHIDKCEMYIDKRIELNKDDLKTYSFGPDLFVFSDINIFHMQHNKNSRYFFECLLSKIKESKSLENKELISFLYGELSHFILDISFHPYVYYITKDLNTNNLINAHLQIELWLDSYIMNKYNINNTNYYNKTKINDDETRKIIDYTYYKIYKCLFASLKIDFGINAINTIESKIRNNKNIDTIANYLKIGNVIYNEDDNRILDYLNLDKNVWLNPITGEEKKESFQEMWNNSVELYLETIFDINKYLYDNETLNIRIIKDNLSYDTALPCENEHKMIYTKKY